MSIDTKIINYCIALARKGYSQVKQNPPVGAVIIDGNRVISTGFHAEHGIYHAEVVALSKLNRPYKNAVLYVSLEPCSHHGKTPPCVEAIIKSGIKKVVFAEKDPNQIASGGADKLREAGIEVVQRKTKASSVFLEPWINKVISKRRTLEIFSMLTLNGYSVDPSMCKDKRFSNYFTFFKNLIKKNTQSELESFSNENNLYHFNILNSSFSDLINRVSFEQFFKENNIFLKVLRVPFFVEEKKDKFSKFILPFSQLVEWELLDVKRYKSSVLETYSGNLRT